jgi:glycosyltransferase involved in cell wall biosynthesis
MTDTTPVASVVIPAYNCDDVIENAIESTLRQTIDDIEVIVVDDGSVDDTATVVEQISDPRVTLIQHKTNQGRSAARNTGIANASGEFVAYLDADDAWRSRKLEAQISELQRRPDNWIAAYCDAIYNRSEGLTQLINDLVPRQTGLEGGQELKHEVLMWRVAIHPGSTLIIRRSAAEEIGHWNISLSRSEDRGYLLQILDAGKLAYVNKELVEIQDSGTPDPETTRREFETFFDEYADQISAVEQTGYDVCGAHRFILSKGYISDGQFIKGIRQLSGATCPHIRDILGLGMAVKRGLASISDN